MSQAPPTQGSLADQASEAILGANPFVGIDAYQMVLDAFQWATRMAVHPRQVGAEAARTGLELGRVIAGRSQLGPASGDRRFADPAWTDNPVYRRLMQGYFALAASAQRLVDDAGLDEADAQRAHFMVTLLSDALAPTNALATNPAALKRAFDTAGWSIVRGARNYVRDLRENGGMPATVDDRPFQVGGNVAISPGSVVHRDEVFELIYYRPSTESVFERPLIVIPPQINKFYVLDIAPGRSFTEHSVRSGIPYLAISWRNPKAADRDWGLDRYVQACLDAIDVAREITGSDSVNLMGLCAGGVTASLVLGYLAAVGRADSVASATLAVAMLDMRTPSMLGMFASDAAVAAALRRSRQKGILDGAEMARVFAWMRPNDLVWNYWVNNYLLGNDPPAFDILFWNADNTRLPARLHADFLDLYLRNPLAEAGETAVLGESIDLRQVECPTYTVAGITDHIVPWRAAHRTSQMFGGEREFVLSSSGHIQSIVNPPGNPKAAYFAGGGSLDDPDEWLRAATQSKGSWWEHWVGWVTRQSAGSRPAPKRLGNRKHRSLGPAPGQYVLQR
jgi:polyhydroxyalkanoate synthase